MNVQMSSSSYKNNNMFTDIHDRYQKKFDTENPDWEIPNFLILWLHWIFWFEFN